MSAGLRDLLALQGVIPLSKSVVTVSPGLTLGQASGVWITGGNPSVIVATPGITLLQSMGVWITGAGEAVIVTPETGIIGGSRGIERLRSDDEEVILLVSMAFIEMIK